MARRGWETSRGVRFADSLTTVCAAPAGLPLRDGIDLRISHPQIITSVGCPSPTLRHVVFSIERPSTWSIRFPHPTLLTWLAIY